MKFLNIAFFSFLLVLTSCSSTKTEEPGDNPVEDGMTYYSATNQVATVKLDYKYAAVKFSDGRVLYLAEQDSDPAVTEYSNQVENMIIDGNRITIKKGTQIIFQGEMK